MNRFCETQLDTTGASAGLRCRLASVSLRCMNILNPLIGNAALARRIAAWLVMMTPIDHAQYGHAQDAPPSPPPAESSEPAQTEMQKWIATTDAQWQASLKRDVTDVHLTELEKLKQQYVAALEAAVTKASTAGDLDGAVALRNEEKRFAGTNLLPEQDETADAATVKQIRAAVRAQIAKLEKETAARTKALHTKYDAYLGDAQTRLTKAQRIEDALLVKAKREEVAKAWIAPAVTTFENKAVLSASAPKSPGTGAKPTEAVTQPKPASAEDRLVGTRWTFPDKGQPAENQWIEFRANGVLQIGWDAAPRIWKPLPDGRAEVHPYQSRSFTFVLSFDADLRQGKVLEGLSKGKTITPLASGTTPKEPSNAGTAKGQTFEKQMIGTTWTFPWDIGNNTVRFEENGKLVLLWATSSPRKWRIPSDGVIEVFPYSDPSSMESIQMNASGQTGVLTRKGKTYNINRKK